MSLRVQKNYLIFNNIKYRCAIGKNGFIKEKKEGDGCTPIGSFKFKKIFYRKDRIKNIHSKIQINEIKLDDGWCDDSNHEFYNQFIQFPFSYNAEHLYREDNLYNIICTLDHNQNPTVSGLGSAIFIHVASDSYKATEGCVALKQSDLLTILEKVDLNTQVIIGD